MAKGLKEEKLRGRNFALTILLGVFITIMVSILFNLIVSYAYEGPKYEGYCTGTMANYFPDQGLAPVKYAAEQYLNCTFPKALREKFDNCSDAGGMVVSEYDDKGCTVGLKECNFCERDFGNAMKVYNRNSFFIFAPLGFILIVIGLFVKPLLLQIATLPAGAILVIEAAMSNFNDKLMVIIIFTLLIVAAVYLALKKLK